MVSSITTTAKKNLTGSRSKFVSYSVVENSYEASTDYDDVINVNVINVINVNIIDAIIIPKGMI